MEAGEITVVGVNKYVLAEEEQPEILRVPDEVQERQVQRLRDIRRTRDNRRVSQALRDLKAAARSGENLMPRLLECARAYATLGEMCDTLREVFGEYRDRAIF